MFRNITEKIKKDNDYPERRFTIDVYGRVRDGAIYDHLPHAFHEEKGANDEYVPLRDRRPSVQYNICKVVVDDSISLLFGEGHFPTFDAEDQDKNTTINSLLTSTALNLVMVDAAEIGSVGSVAIHMQVLKQKSGKYRVFYKPHSTEFLTPTFNPQCPDELTGLREQYKVKGDVLLARGYAIPTKDGAREFWFRREWDADSETWFLPFPVKAESPEEIALQANPTIDDKRTVKHSLGFVPWVWVRNLPGKLRLVPQGAADAPRFSDIDGKATFAAAIAIMVEIDYLLSQSGRGLKYTMDPQLVLKESMVDQSTQMVRSASSALLVDKDGDAKLLEISGKGFDIVLDWVRALRELAIEQIHGNRAEPSKLSSAQSGRALELLNQALIWLADKMRISYGEGALRTLMRMTLEAHEKFPLEVDGVLIPPISVDGLKLNLKWPKWYSPTAQDHLDESTTLKTLKDGGLISTETAVKRLQNDYDIDDPAAELTRIEADKKAEIALVAAENAAVQVKVNA